MLSLADIQELLGLEVLGLIPESKAVLTSTNVGQPVIMAEGRSERPPCPPALYTNSAESRARDSLRPELGRHSALVSMRCRRKPTL